MLDDKDPKYKYGKAFQSKVVSLMSRDPHFVFSFRDVLNPSYFSFFEWKEIATLVLKYVDDRKVLPTAAALESLVVEHCSKFGLNDGARSSLFAAASLVFQSDLSDREHILERVIAFGRRQAVQAGVMNIINSLKIDDDESLDGIVETLRDSLNVGSGCLDLGIRLDGESMFKVPEWARSDNLFAAKARVPTMYVPSLDTAMRGGLAPGEVGCVAGYTGRGKSVTLVNFAASCIEQDIPVVYYTFELPKIDVSVRLMSSLTGQTTDEVLAGVMGYETAVRKLLNQKKPYARVQYFTPKSVGVNAIRSHLSRLISQDEIKPGLVIIDYADKLLSKSNGKGDGIGGSYTEMGNVYEGLIGLAHDFAVPVWTASQLNRHSKGDNPGVVQDLDSVADSFRKATDVDTFITLNQTREEKVNGIIRLFTAKMRRGIDGEIIPCTIDYPRMQIREGGLNVPVFSNTTYMTPESTV